MCNFYHVWKLLTSDKFILQCIKGVEIDLMSNVVQSRIPNPIRCCNSEKGKIDAEIDKFVRNKIIVEVEPLPDQFISNIFPRCKSSGQVRVILNLKSLNDEIEYEHFKMENLSSALSLVEEHCFMASIDLKDAYYSVNVDPKSRKLLRFFWREKLYEFTCLPNGLSSAPRIFTKIMKPIFAKLRNAGFLSVYYLDDSWLMGTSFEECSTNVEATGRLLMETGFVINYGKSSLVPKQKIKFLGFVIDSVSMTISLPEEKRINITDICKEILSGELFRIRFIAKFIGILVSSLPAVEYGSLFYKYLEMDKIHSLAKACGNFDANMRLSTESLSEVNWWLTNIMISKNRIRTPPTDFVMSTDASNLGWGCVFNGVSTGGQWAPEESDLHINSLELKAIHHGLKSFFKKSTDVHILVQTDNTVAAYYVNNYGGVKSRKCHEIARDIWTWASERKIFLSAAYLPGSENVLADKASRVFDENTEWELNKEKFDFILGKFGPFSIDLFASRLNAKTSIYCSWKPDPGAKHIDAFSVSWDNYKNFYAFPPFSLVMKCLLKICMDNVSGILIVPLWPTQSWFPKLMRMLTDVPLLLPKDVIQLPFKKGQNHKLHQSLRLLVCPVSGNVSEAEGFLKNPLILCLRPGEDPPHFSMKFICESGFISVIKRKLIPCHIMK